MDDHDYHRWDFFMEDEDSSYDSDCRDRGETYTITFCDQAENHAGMQTLGKMADEGFDLGDFEEAKRKFEDQGCECRIYSLQGLSFTLSNDLPFLLVVKNGVDALFGIDPDEEERIGDGADSLYREHRELRKDKKAFMRGKVVNKIARHNLCFGDQAQKADFENKKGTIVPFEAVDYTREVREKLPEFLGEKAKNLVAEANYYYDPKKCYIGFHGDSERRIVCGIRLGEPFPLHFQWYHDSKPVGDRLELLLGHGDLYFMSEKTVGTDWKKKKIPTLRHAAGFAKTLKLDAYPIDLSQKEEYVKVVLSSSTHDRLWKGEKSLASYQLYEKKLKQASAKVTEKYLVTVTLRVESGTISVHKLLEKEDTKILERDWKLFSSSNRTLSNKRRDDFAPSGGCCGQSRCFVCSNVYGRVKDVTIKELSTDEVLTLEKINFDSGLQKGVFGKLLDFDDSSSIKKNRHTSAIDFGAFK